MICRFDADDKFDGDDKIVFADNPNSSVTLLRADDRFLGAFYALRASPNAIRIS